MRHKFTKTPRYTSHPYMIYMRSSNAFGKNPTGKFMTNNYGFGNETPTDIKKKEGVTRVICIGGSTTEMVWKTHDNTYPNWLQRTLGDKYEVINAGVSGYTTVEMLINLQLRLINFKPDIIVIYAGFNDCKAASIYEKFKVDYSHARVPLGFSYVPKKNMMRNILPLDAKIRTDRVPEIAIQTYRRNICNMIAIATCWGITPIVLEMNIKPKHNYPDNMIDGIRRNIEATRNIVPNYVQVQNLTDKDFIDGCHFNTEGMQKVAKAVAKEICENTSYGNG